MAVVGLGQQFPTGILNGNEGFGLRAGVSAHPADSLVGGIVYALVGYGDNLPVVWKQVAEGAATAAGVAGHPGDTAVGGVFNSVIGRVDSDQLVAIGYQLGHSVILCCEVSDFRLQYYIQ